MAKVLVVVDMQNDFITGSLGSDMALTTVIPVLEKIKKAQKNGDAIIVTKDTHTNSYADTLEGKKLPVEHCIYDTEGWAIHPVIRAQLEKKDFLEIKKPTFGIFDIKEYVKMALWEKDFKEEDLDEIEVCGLCTDICVISNVTILRAAYPNVPITVDSTACAGTSINAHQAALTVMRSIQIDVI